MNNRCFCGDLPVTYRDIGDGRSVPVCQTHKGVRVAKLRSHYDEKPKVHTPVGLVEDTPLPDELPDWKRWGNPELHTPRHSFRVSDQLWNAFAEKAGPRRVAEELRRLMQEYVS